MILENLSIIGYRNIAQANVGFCPKINTFVGLNGVGKTSFLDAIYYLSFCKSSLGVADSVLTGHGSEGFMLQGVYREPSADNTLPTIVSAGYQLNKRKHFSFNKKEYSRYSDHIGVIPLVISSPYDLELISGVSAERRRFMDMVISQYDKEYLTQLIYYNRALEQRNALLKSQSGSQDLFCAVECNMDSSANIIFEKRRSFCEKLSPLFNEYYQAIGTDREKVNIKYVSSLETEPLQSLLERNRQKDLILGYSTAGVHRDDIDMTLDGFPIRKEASQGQIKSYLTALRFAQFKLLRSLCNTIPILLLDDLFDKLDENRVNNILSLVAGDDFGQTFITDATPDRLGSMLEQHSNGIHKVFNVKNGAVQ